MEPVMNGVVRVGQGPCVGTTDSYQGETVGVKVLYWRKCHFQRLKNIKEIIASCEPIWCQSSATEPQKYPRSVHALGWANQALAKPSQVDLEKDEFYMTREGAAIISMHHLKRIPEYHFIGTSEQLSKVYVLNHFFMEYLNT